MVRLKLHSVVASYILGILCELMDRRFLSVVNNVTAALNESNKRLERSAFKKFDLKNN